MNFEKMFIKATEIEEGPFPYQQKIAEGDAFPSLLEIPTGAGKTAAAILGWLWRRRFASESIRRSTPRRLVYCLPMRVLVEQTRDCTVTWLRNLNLIGGLAKFEDSAQDQRLKSYEPFPNKEEDDPEKIRVHLLMGGDVDRDWDMYPERDAILIGTQDMLLSRALNRGYAMSRYRWPVQFGLLNNDCLWIMDEVQLMSNGLATTAQLQAFRRILGTFKTVQSVWMSATVHPNWLKTVDSDLKQDAVGHLELSDEDKIHKILKPRFEANKPIQKANFKTSEDGKAEADFLFQHHEAGTRSLMIVNTVKRAQNIYIQLKKKKPVAEIVLLHSRFRPPDRKAALEGLLAPPKENGTIGICTQVVEAGVDVSARLLISDLAPWASLVQRFGRCNRKGEFNNSKDARIIWIEPETLDDPKKVLPYSIEELKAAQLELVDLMNAGPKNLPAVINNLVYTDVLRKKDMVEFFDTTPDLVGADIDVSRFIREADEHDVQVFWREFDDKGPSEDEPGPSRDELCNVSITDFKKFKKYAWRWDYLDKIWVKVKDIYPGLVLMLRSDDGGYERNTGWTGAKGRTEPAAFDKGNLEDANERDRFVSIGQWQTIARHTDQVVAELFDIINVLKLENAIKDELLKAARWHDAGKAHEIFQDALPQPLPDAHRQWAKSPGGPPIYKKRHFRHELASAIAMLLNGQGDLAAYLAAAHHGKVRLSIRSLPDEKMPENENYRFARGIWDGDQLPATYLGDGVMMPATMINLSYMELGDDEVTGPSWLARMLSLRDDPELGPFRLAFLEALLRIADWRASARNSNPVKEVKDGE
jgi:CRISPR-associated endonuclease/helicase Cas3